MKGKKQHLTWGELLRESEGEVSRGHSSEEGGQRRWSEGPKDQGAKLEERLTQAPNRFPGVPGRKVLPPLRKKRGEGERNGEQADAEAVEPLRAEVGGSQGECRETLDRK